MTNHMLEHQQLLDAGEIRSFEGIEYFENLREIQLYTWSKAEKLHLDHLKLEVVAVTVPSLKEFSLNDAANVKCFWYEACGNEAIAWESLRNLEYFRVEGMEINLSVLSQYEKLTQVSIYEGSIYADQTKVDFSALQQLQEIDLFLSESAEKVDNAVLEELSFAENATLEQVGLSRKLTEKLVLPDFETYYWLRGKGEDCQVSYYAETVAEYPENLEKGAIPLNAEHFPDVAFRQYLYLYADKDRDRIFYKSV